MLPGGRPKIPEIEGAREHGITSDDLFWLKKDPGKTLVVGASYVALECAGFLRGIGRDCSLMMRSIPLRGFDRDMADRIVKFMEGRGVNFIRDCMPTKVEKKGDGKLIVEYGPQNAAPKREEYDNVLFAVGRVPEVSKIGLDTIGVQLAKVRQDSH